MDDSKFKAKVGTNPKAEKKYKSQPRIGEETLDTKKNKVKQKRKNRTKLYLGEDDAFNDIKSSYNRLANSSNLSLSIARPPKPETNGEIKKLSKASKKSSNHRTQKRQASVKKQKYIEPPSEVKLNNAISILNLSELSKISHEEIIKFLFLQGTIVNINQIVDLETATLVLNNFDIEVDNDIAIEKENIANKLTTTIQETNSNNLKVRDPIVTIMGHVDHGKTTLLDAIRKKDDKIAQSEAGGITQNIGTYQVSVNYQSERKTITFLDTPGHEAFIAMRERGAKLADIAILIIAADDGIKPQTEEALQYIQEANISMIIAITKIDKDTANPDNIKEQLGKYNIIPEEWGGKTSVIPVSSASNENIDKLIENILILAELKDLKVDYSKPARGTVIESYIDKQKGHVAKVIIKEGELKIGNIIVCGNTIGKTRSITDTNEERINMCGPSSIVTISGLSGIASIGEELCVFSSEKEAKKAISLRKDQGLNTSYLQQKSNYVPIEYGINTANKKIQIILKTNTQGSLESILYSIKNIPQEKIQVEILEASSGEITENDINLAISTNSLVLAFNVSTNPGAKNIASKNNLTIRNYRVIYDLIENLENQMISLLEPEYLENEIGAGEIKATFNLSRGVIAGCYVISGKLKKDTLIKVYSKDMEIYKGNLDSIKKVKEDVAEIEAQQECGLFVKEFQEWQSGNIVKSFELIEKKQTL
nr:InfB [Porphyrostromium boryanum]